MNKIALGLAALTIGAIASTQASANINAYKGVWVNVNPSTSGLTKLRIKRLGGIVRVNAFGQCHPTDCNWGTVNGFAFGPSVSVHPFLSTRTLVASYKPSFARKMLIIERAGSNRLRVKVLTRFVDGSGRKPYSKTYLLKRKLVAGPVTPPPVVTVKEDCVAFSPYSAKIKKIGGAWKLVDGNHWIKSFGNKPLEALRALKVVKAYKLNRICFVGRPGASMEYFKRYAKLPAGNLPGQDCIAINPFTMTIRLIGGKYVLANGNHLVKAFPNLVEAKTGPKIMRKLRAKYSCFVGRPGPSMTYLRRI